MSISKDASPVEFIVSSDTSVTSVTTPADIDVIPKDDLSITGRKHEYSVIGDGLYASVSADHAPGWLTQILDSVVNAALSDFVFEMGNALSDAMSGISSATSGLSVANANILQAISEIEVARNTYDEQINIAATIDSIIASRLASLNASLGETNDVVAEIKELQTAYVTEEMALALSAGVVEASLNAPDGIIRGAIGRLESVVTTLEEAVATNFTDVSAQLDDISSTVIQEMSTLASLGLTVARNYDELSVQMDGLTGTVLQEMSILAALGQTVARNYSELSVEMDDLSGTVIEEKGILASLEETVAKNYDLVSARMQDVTAMITQEVLALVNEDEALAQRITNLSLEFGNNTAAVSDALEALIDEDKALAKRITDFQLEFENSWAVVSDELEALVAEDGALASRITDFQLVFENNSAQVSDELEALVSEDKALAKRITDFELDVEDNSARVSNELEALIEEDKALASRITDFHLEFENNSAAVTDELEALAGEDQALAKRITDFELVFEDNWAIVSDELEALVDEDKALAKRITDFHIEFEDDSVRVSGELEALVDEDKALAKRITDFELEYEGNSSTVSDKLEALIDEDKALAKRITDFELEYEGNSSIVSDKLEALIDEDEALATRITDFQLEYGYNTVSVSDELEALVNEDKALAQRITNLKSDFEGNVASVSDELEALVDEDKALASRITELTSEFEGNSASVSDEMKALVDEDEALAESIRQLDVELGGLSATVSQEMVAFVTDDGAPGARFKIDLETAGVKDPDGNPSTLIGGLVLESDGHAVSGGFDVDNFWLGRAGNNGKHPFAIQGSDIYFNGKVEFSSVVGDGKPEAGATRNEFRGLWISGTSYIKGDIVTLAGESWVTDTAHASTMGNKPGTDGTWRLLAAKGNSVTTVNIYRRSATELGDSHKPTGTSTYNFETNTGTGLNNSWTYSIPEGFDALYVSVASVAAEGTSDIGTIEGSQWSTPVKYVENGLNTATVFVFKRTSSDTAPAKPGGTSVYSFRTQSLTTSPTNGWVEDLPTTGGPYRWMSKATAASTSGTDNIAAAEWSPPRLIAEDGIQGAKGNTGAAGSSARKVDLIGNVSAIAYNADGVKVTDSASFTAYAGNISGTPFYEFFVNDVSQGPSSTTNTFTYVPPTAFADAPVSIEVEVREGSASSTIVARDEVTLVRVKAGSDAIAASLSNEAHVFTADVSGNVSSYVGSGTSISVFQGATKLQYEAGTGAPSANGRFRVSIANAGITAGTVTVSSTDASVGNASNMTAEAATLVYTIRIRNTSGVVSTITKTQSFSKSRVGATGAKGGTGAAGRNARAVKLTASKAALKYSAAGDTPSPASITFTAEPINTSGTLGYLFYIDDVAVGASTSTTNTYTYTAPPTISPTPVSVEVELYEDSNLVARDEVTLISLRDGSSTVAATLSNEAHVVPSSASGSNPVLGGSGTVLRVFEGGTPLTFAGTGNQYPALSAKGTYNIERVLTGLTAPNLQGASTTSLTQPDYTAMTADVATVVFNIRIRRLDGTTEMLTKVQTLSKSKQGGAGAPGPSGASHITIYKKSVDKPSKPTGDSIPSDWSVEVGASWTGNIWKCEGRASAGSTTIVWSEPTIDFTSWKAPSKTTINGAYIETGTITAKQIEAHSITANEIETGTFLGVNGTFTGTLDVKSGTSSSRMEIKSNSIKVWDKGILRVQIGDLSA